MKKKNGKAMTNAFSFPLDFLLGKLVGSMILSAPQACTAAANSRQKSPFITTS